MRLFQRVGDIVAANLNDLVDRFDDPEVMLKHAIREMETMIEGATGAAARAIAAERVLARDLSDHQRVARRWKDRAQDAVAHGNDGLARQAIARALEHEATADALANQRSSSEQTVQAIRSQISAIKARHAEASRKLASLSASRQIAANGRAVRGMACMSSSGTNGFARYERMRNQIEYAQIEAEIMIELDDLVESSLEAKVEANERYRRVEAELSAIKERQKSAQGPGGQ
jgi:phage shock protein A